MTLVDPGAIGECDARTQVAVCERWTTITPH